MTQNTYYGGMMLENQKGMIKKKVIILSLLIVVLIGGTLYFSGIYPAPNSKLTVGSIGGAERAERYRNSETGQIELDKNEINMFFQSAEWQNISKDPKLLAMFENKEMMQFLSQVNGVKQFIGLYNNLENYTKANNISSQIELNSVKFEKLSEWINALPVEQAIYVTNLQQNGQLDNLLKIFGLVNASNISENEKLETLFNAACFWSFRIYIGSNDIGLLSSKEIDAFKAGFTSVILNSETGMNLVNLVNSNNFNSQLIKAMYFNKDALSGVTSLNQDLTGFVINNSEIQHSISEWINNTDISNIINSNMFSRFMAANQDFNVLLEAIRY